MTQIIKADPETIRYDGQNGSLYGTTHECLLYYGYNDGRSERWMFRSRSAMYRFVLDRGKQNPSGWRYTVDTGDPDQPMFLTATLDELKSVMQQIPGDELVVFEPKDPKLNLLLNVDNSPF
ncbi:hypothetical protein [Niabella ginsenosidivorans]|uniref:hypothetical protein n=1 Tax=Niabella ginsenosidivorans TaxID=1176587 RepID=UPI0012EE5AA0|nr:hypothetical protein [Niabella ginsenosidivorans]